jgi:hypothetical protein|tara:strand:- start:999 stop:1262 length:264 start_codon:yes stop_codon:yes gene_type:complete
MTDPFKAQQEAEAAESKRMIDEWLSKDGNEITHLPYGARSEEVNYTSGMYAKKKKIPTPEELKAKAEVDKKNAAAVKKAQDNAENQK